MCQVCYLRPCFVSNFICLVNFLKSPRQGFLISEALSRNQQGRIVDYESMGQQASYYIENLAAAEYRVFGTKWKPELAESLHFKKGDSKSLIEEDLAQLLQHSGIQKPSTPSRKPTYSQ